MGSRSKKAGYTQNNTTTMAISFRLQDRLNDILRNKLGPRPEQIRRSRRDYWLFQYEVVEIALGLLEQKIEELKKHGEIEDWIIKEILAIEARKKM